MALPWAAKGHPAAEIQPWRSLVSAYLETLSRPDGGYAWPDQPHSHLTPTFAVVGTYQALALVPGTSRSGITMTAGLMSGLSRTSSARFSFLLSIPVIVLAGGLKTLELMQNGNGVHWLPLITGAAISGISAYLCIHFFIKLLDRVGMLPFVIYRLLLGVLLLVLFYPV